MTRLTQHHPKVVVLLARLPPPQTISNVAEYPVTRLNNWRKTPTRKRSRKPLRNTVSPLTQRSVSPTESLTNFSKNELAKPPMSSADNFKTPSNVRQTTPASAPKPLLILRGLLILHQKESLLNNQTNNRDRSLETNPANNPANNPGNNRDRSPETNPASNPGNNRARNPETSPGNNQVRNRDSIWKSGEFPPAAQWTTHRRYLKAKVHSP